MLTATISKLKILLIITQMEAAGAQKAMLTLARGLQQRGHDVTVATMYDKADYVPLFSQQYGVRIVDLQMKQPNLMNAICFVRGFWRLHYLMQKERFDIVQTFSLYSNIIGPVIAWLAGVRVRVSSQRGSLRGSPKWLLYLDRLVANSFFVQNMVAVSESTRQFSITKQGIAAEKLLTIHNGIDVAGCMQDFSEIVGQLRLSLGLPEYAKVVTTVARLSSQKGHQFLLEAAPEILRVFPEVVFLFVGDGELSEMLKAQAESEGIANAIRFLGVRKDVFALLALSDVFVLPSLWEGLPNAVLEAMAMGLPVVATDVDGSVEVIVDEETGILVPPADAQALVEAISWLLGDRDLRVRMGRAARARVTQAFSEEKSIEKFLALYQSLVGA